MFVTNSALAQRNLSEGGHDTYAVVSAVYNVEKYLDKYFKSLTNQTLDFKKNIFLYLIDDGSTDGSALIIKDWAKRYPDNIRYIKKNNGGQASARNLGLEYVEQQWVTFIDSDDFVKRNYFEIVDEFLSRKMNRNIGLVSCNVKFYFEKTRAYKDHYLSYRFRVKEKIVNPTNMQGYIQSTANSVFFRTTILLANNSRFGEKIKPTYEDGHFVNQLLIEWPEVGVAFLQLSEYYYRKRSDLSSTMDGAWQNPARFTDAIELGLLDLLIEAKEKHEIVPIFIQRYVLYHLLWYFKKIVFHDFSTEHLSAKDLSKFKRLLIDVFSYIDTETIESCALGAMTHRYRLGLLSIFKNETISLQVYYIDAYNSDDDVLSLHYYYVKPSSPVFSLNNTPVTVLKEEDISHYFFEKVFVYEKKIQLKVEGFWGRFDVYSCDAKTELSLNKKRYKHGIPLRRISKILINMNDLSHCDKHKIKRHKV